MFGKWRSLFSTLTFFYSCHSDMINIFEVFLPQLLRYPNPNDPLNGEAAALLMRHPQEYEQKVKGIYNSPLSLLYLFISFVDYVQRYATKEMADAAAGQSKDEDDKDEDEELSDVGSFSDNDS